MYTKAPTDKLMDLCCDKAEQIAEQWYKALISNPRTPSFRLIPKESCIRHAIFLYTNLRRMYFSDNPSQEVSQVLNSMGYSEEMYGRDIPQPEVIYALVLIRRFIWLNAESSAVFNDTAVELYSMLQSTNRVLLLFDYAIYEVASKYAEMSKR